MCRLLPLIVLCAMFIAVSSDGDLKDCIFDFEYFESQPNSEDIIIDFSGQHISTLTEGSKTYHYITGEFKTNSQVDSSIQASYSITKLGDKIVDMDVRDACDFSAHIFQQYLRPICGKHSDTPRNTTLCDRDPSIIMHYFPVNSSKDLVGASKLDEGNYYMTLFFTKDDKVVGGMSGQFKVIPV